MAAPAMPVTIVMPKRARRIGNLRDRIRLPIRVYISRVLYDTEYSMSIDVRWDCLAPGRSRGTWRCDLRALLHQPVLNRPKVQSADQLGSERLGILHPVRGLLRGRRIRPEQHDAAQQGGRRPAQDHGVGLYCSE